LPSGKTQQSEPIDTELISDDLLIFKIYFFNSVSRQQMLKFAPELLTRFDLVGSS
jgi:hypothetical protein